MKIFGQLWRRKTHQRQKQFVNLFVDDSLKSRIKRNSGRVRSRITQQGRVKYEKRRAVKPVSNQTIGIHPNFRKHLQLIKSPYFGRFVQSNETLSVGEEVITVQPFASVVRAHKNVPYCLTCHEVDVDFITCKRCFNVYFCNLRCKNANLSHELECGTDFHEINNLDAKCAIQIVLEAMTTFENFENLRDFVQLAIKNRNGIPVASNSKASRLDCILKLKLKEFQSMPTIVDARESAMIAFRHIVTFPEVKFYFLENEDGWSFLEHFIAHCVSVIIENGFRDSLLGREEFDRVLLYDVLSFLNHSCSPNLLHFLNGNQMTCITTQRIQRGEQLFINYREFLDQSKDERQRQLNFWGFECKCERCEYGRDINDEEFQIASRMNKNELENELQQVDEWTPQIGAYVQRYAELLCSNEIQ